MKTIAFLFTALLLLVLPACSPVPAAAPTATSIPINQATVTPLPSTPLPPTATSVPPTVTPAPALLPQFVIRDPVKSAISLVDPAFPAGLGYHPAFNGFLPAGGVANNTAYVLDFTGPTRAVAINPRGQGELTFVDHPNYGLAVFPGTASAMSLLAWGTQPTDAQHPSELHVSALDGSNPRTLANAAGFKQPVQIVAEAWSPDGQWLYYSIEPTGIGGYIIFSGASSLLRVNLSTKAVETLVPFGNRWLCLDAYTTDFRYVADSCAKTSITIRDLNNPDASVTLQAPSGATGFTRAGSSRFSPDGQQIAFALAKQDPSAEQGWLAVGPSAGGSSKLVHTFEAGSYGLVVGWLNDSTLLLQVMPSNGEQSLWTIGSDGSNLTKVATGQFLTLLDR